MDMKISAEKFWEILFTDEAFRIEDWKTKYNSVDCIITPRRFEEALRALNQVLKAASPSEVEPDEREKKRLAYNKLNREKGGTLGPYAPPMRAAAPAEAPASQPTADPKARFLKISLLMEKHSRGQVFSEAMMSFPSKLFHEWCDLGRQLEKTVLRHFYERLGDGTREDPFRFVPIDEKEIR